MTAKPLPYQPIRQAGDYYFVSGQIGKDMAANSAAPDIESQTAKLMENLKTTLETAGLTFGHIVKTTVFLTDMGDFPAFNDVYASFLTEPYPARSTIAVKELPRVADVPLKVEIEAVAYKQSA